RTAEAPCFRGNWRKGVLSKQLSQTALGRSERVAVQFFVRVVLCFHGDYVGTASFRNRRAEEIVADAIKALTRVFSKVLDGRLRVLHPLPCGGHNVVERTSRYPLQQLLCAGRVGDESRRIAGPAWTLNRIHLA